MITKPLNYLIRGIFPLGLLQCTSRIVMTIRSRYLSSYLSGCIYLNSYNSIPSLLPFYLSIYLSFSLLSAWFSPFSTVTDALFVMYGVAQLGVAWLDWVGVAQLGLRGSIQ
jgi:hypothetical protein